MVVGGGDGGGGETDDAIVSLDLADAADSRGGGLAGGGCGCDDRISVEIALFYVFD